MGKLPKELKVCPICHTLWIPDAKNNISERHFSCRGTCGIELITLENDIWFVKKTLEDRMITEIWWCSDRPCEIKIDDVFCEISFVPPYTVNVERLKLLLLFD